MSKDIGKKNTHEIKIDGKEYTFKDPIISVVEIFQALNLTPPDEFVLFQALNDGQLEEIPADGNVDIGRENLSQLFTNKKDQLFQFVIDGKEIKWGISYITGLKLKQLAGVDTDSYGVWLLNQIGDDKLIANDEGMNLKGDGTEKFFTGIDTTTEGAGAMVLPPEDRNYLVSQKIRFEECIEGDVKAVILKSQNLPKGIFDEEVVDILIFLPPSYPDSAPDMFYLMPWVRLISNNNYPNAANVPRTFCGQNWQRWSRHNKLWRPGVDGIWTMIRRINKAIGAAK